MLEIIYGNNREQKLDHVARTLKDVSYDAYDHESLDYEKITSLIAGDNLFQEKHTIVIYGLWNDAEGVDFFSEYVGHMATCEHRIFLVEEKLLAAQKKICKEHNIPTHEYKNISKKNEGFDMFRLAEAYARKDKKNLWIVFHEAQSAAKDEMDIFNMLWWQVKNLALVKKSKTNPGLHPFVYQKTQSAVQKFTEEEIDTIMHDFVSMYHEARMSKQKLIDALEQHIINL